jgi:hypothetical protein
LPSNSDAKSGVTLEVNRRPASFARNIQANVRKRTDGTCRKCQRLLMTATLSSEYDDFLFAPIADDAAGVPQTVLTTLARLNLDPWDEAATLFRLPRDSATERLASLIAVPAATAMRLVKLLHEPTTKRPRFAAATPQRLTDTPVKRVSKTVYYLLAIAFLLIGLWAMAIGQPRIPAESTPAPATVAS